MMNKNYYAVIMAGGVGSRFWPVSTSENPKQFHDMLGTGQSLIQNTYSRLTKLIPRENVLVATNAKYKNLVNDHLPELEDDQILLEPAMRNTAPCVLYSALKIQKKNEEAVMIIAPSDHYIEDEDTFIKHIKTAFEFSAKNEALTTLGIKPTNPNTGYGYIEFHKNEDEIKAVNAFREKPDKPTAIKFLEQGNYLWNAGIFIWSVKAIKKAFSEFLPQMTALLEQGNEVYNTLNEESFINREYPNCENISIDYGIMEKANNVFVLPVSFGWNDLGTWGSLFNKLSKDSQNNAIVNAQTVMIEASDNMVSTLQDKKIIIKGLSGLIVVDTGDTLLICPKDQEQEIKQISAKAKETFKNN